MEIQKEESVGKIIRLFVRIDGREIGHAFLCLCKNDQHEQPFGLMEDVFISEECRGRGLGTKLANKLIAEAKKQNCYKLVACSRHSRPRVHKMYLKLGFQDWGKEFRINF